MGTKSKWRADKLAFHSAPMFTSVGSMSANVIASSCECKTETVLVSAPDYVGNFTTQHNQCFRAVVGGVISSSSAHVDVTLRRGTDDILALQLNTADAHVASTAVPWGVEFNGRIVEVSSSGSIAATGKAWVNWQGGTTEVYGGTTGGTTAVFATTGSNFIANSTLGFNITMQHSTAKGSMFAATHGYIQFFEG